VIAPGRRSVCWTASGSPSRSGGGGERSKSGQRVVEVLLPGPAGGKVQRPAGGVRRQAAGQREQPAAHGSGRADDLAGRAEQFCPAQQVVHQAYGSTRRRTEDLPVAPDATARLGDYLTEIIAASTIIVMVQQEEHRGCETFAACRSADLRTPVMGLSARRQIGVGVVTPGRSGGQSLAREQALDCANPPAALRRSWREKRGLATTRTWSSRVTDWDRSCGRMARARTAGRPLSP
jgi:hypothetical protein